eukprot:5333864-Pyramimonas_sp.AAC.1
MGRGACVAARAIDDRGPTDERGVRSAGCGSRTAARRWRFETSRADIPREKLEENPEAAEVAAAALAAGKPAPGAASSSSGPRA